jgi:hypothetical protein
MLIVHVQDKDVDFCRIEDVDSDISSGTFINFVDDCKPSLDPSPSHLTKQRSLFTVLDRYSECFSDKPGFCSIHRTQNTCYIIL